MKRLPKVRLPAEFPPALRETLIQDAVRVEFPAGQQHITKKTSRWRCHYWAYPVDTTSPDGRQITGTLRAGGDLLGIAADRRRACTHK